MGAAAFESYEYSLAVCPPPRNILWRYPNHPGYLVCVARSPRTRELGIGAFHATAHLRL